MRDSIKHFGIVIETALLLFYREAELIVCLSDNLLLFLGILVLQVLEADERGEYPPVLIICSLWPHLSIFEGKFSIT